MSKRMFEFVEGSSNKFWEVWIEGDCVHTRYGKVGAAGQTTVKDEGSPEKAQKLHDKLVAEKTKKGYVEKASQASGAPAAAPAAVAASPATPAFDAKKYAARIAKIEANAKKAKCTLAKGASPAAIAEAEATLGVTFPPEVRAFYLAHDGGPEDDYVCAGRELLSLEGIVGQWKIWKDLLDRDTFTSEGVREGWGDGDEGVRNAWWLPSWLPVTYDGAGNHHMLDLAPDEGGKVGQILSFWHDDSARTLVAPDFLTWLEQVEWGSDDDDGDDGDDGAWRRFEMDEKFWAIARDGSSFTVKYGKIGTEGQEKTKDFDDEATAIKEYDKLVAEKTKKGYEEVDAD